MYVLQSPDSNENAIASEQCDDWVWFILKNLHFLGLGKRLGGGKGYGTYRSVFLNDHISINFVNMYQLVQILLMHKSQS